MKPNRREDSYPTGPQLADLIRDLLSVCNRYGRVLSFPSLLISSAAGRLVELRTAGANAADVAAGFFDRLGFCADRTRMNLHGYPGLLRDLAAPAPWVEVERDDCEGILPPDRARDLQPLYRLATEVSVPHLLTRYKEFLDRRNQTIGEVLLSPVPETVVSRTIALFEYLLGLARCIGAESFDDVSEAVFTCDEFLPFPGAPDLLVWLPDSHDGLWFFAEVKAPDDALRESQREWLRSNWDRIRGRFVQVILE